MELIKPGTNYDFVGKMKWAALASFFLTVLSVIFWFTIRPNYGIDFLGGTEIDITFVKPAPIGEVRKAVEALNLGDVEIKGVMGDRGPGLNYIMRVQKKEISVKGAEGERVDVAEMVVKSLEAKFGPYDKDRLRISTVGPRAGKELRDKAFTAVMFALVLMLVYIAIRFDTVSGIGGIIALFHDVAITIGFLLIIHREFNLTTIAALLTIVGYSINDTVVVYDRIRENAKKYRMRSFGELVNVSINETLSRTILTSGVTMLAIIALSIITRGPVQDFALAMVVGVIVGTYSSIYIASAFVVLWRTSVVPVLERGKKKKRA